MGICYGLQEIARTHGGNVEAHTHREYGYAKISVEKTGHAHADSLFEGIQMEEEGGLQVCSSYGEMTNRCRSGCLMEINSHHYHHISSPSLPPLLHHIPLSPMNRNQYSVSSSIQRCHIVRKGRK